LAAIPAGPAVPSAPEAAETLREKADELRRLSGGRLEVHLSGAKPGTFHAWPDVQRYANVDVLDLDEAQGALAPQAVDELRRVGRFYFGLAKKLEAASA